MKIRMLGFVIFVCAATLSGCGGGGDNSGQGGGVLTPAPPAGSLTLGVERVFPSLPGFTSPVALLQAPGDSSRWFVVEQAGRVMVFANQSGVTTATVFVDIRTSSPVTSGGEMGLLGMAFHPGFPSDRRVYLYYTNESTSGRVSRISVFTTPDNGNTLDPASEQIVLTVNQPETNHKGGGMAFGPDGLLYLGLGDGGGANDQHGTMGNAQDPNTVLGKMIRIDVEGTTGGFRYRIPTDNPNAGNALCGTNGTGAQPCPEIYAVGLRNPWRWSFDRQTGVLWAADVGQSAMEEVDRIERNGNYGWRCFEGTNNTGFGCGSPSNPLPPVAQYGRSLGNSITGGYVYRGTAYSVLVGRYVFGDFGSGRIWSIPVGTAPTMTMTGGFESGLSISSFAQAQNGEIYVLHYSAGHIYHLTAS